MLAVKVVIPTLTNDQGLKKLLDDLAALQLKTQTQNIELEIVVVDNQPNLTKESFCQQFNQIMPLLYLPQPKNLGFAEAVNLGAKKGRNFDWLWVVNDDIELPNHQTLIQLLDAAQKNDWVAITPLLAKPDGKLENIGYLMLPQGKVELNFNQAIFSSTDRNIFNRKQLAGITAAAVLIAQKPWETLGGFDEKFFAYLEDVDLFLRLKKMGGHFGVDLRTKVIHHHQGTSKKISHFKEKQDWRNWWRVVGKNWSRADKIKYAGQILLERGRNLSGYLKSWLPNK